MGESWALLKTNRFHLTPSPDDEAGSKHVASVRMLVWEAFCLRSSCWTCTAVCAGISPNANAPLVRWSTAWLRISTETPTPQTHMYTYTTRTSQKYWLSGIHVKLLVCWHTHFFEPWSCLWFIMHIWSFWCTSWLNFFFMYRLELIFLFSIFSTFFQCVDSFWRGERRNLHTNQLKCILPYFYAYVSAVKN